MTYSLEAFRDVGLNAAALTRLLKEHDARLPALRRLWAYYRNPVVGPVTDPLAAPLFGAGGGVAPIGARSRPRLAQEAGLPLRLAGSRSRGLDDRASAREVVIENDIAWRIHAMTDFMFGKPAPIVSGATDERKRAEIERLLSAAWEASGGIAMLQDAALLASVYGWVDLLVRTDGVEAAADAPGASDALDRALRAARAIRIEVVEPTRGVPLLSARDYRRIDAYIVRTRRATPGETEGAEPRPPRLPLRRWTEALAPTRGREVETVEVISAHRREVYVDGRLREESVHGLGEAPVVHVQNTSQPFVYEGLSEVEPLIPLQDELNTRLSDRANRVTMQSFKMLLAKGIEGFADAPIGPGAVWSTENPDASVTAIGGDAASPSEDRHIDELREAMDKSSGVTPVVTGVLTKVGNLSSESALRVTMTGLLTKTERKRAAFGRGMARASALVLHALDIAGVYATHEHEREMRIQWPDPITGAASSAEN